MEKGLLVEYTGDFEMIVSICTGEIEQRTKIRFGNIDFETYKKSVVIDYDSEDVIFTAWVDKLKTLHLKKVNRYENGKGTDF